MYQSLSFLDNIKHERSSKNTLNVLAASQLETIDIDSQNITSNESTQHEDEFEQYSNVSTPQAITQPSQTPRKEDISTSESRCSTPLLSPKVKKIRIKESKNAFLSKFEERAERRLELLETMQNKKKETEDDVDYFMKSISLNVKKLPPALRNEAKIGILTFVSKLQSKAISFNHQTVASNEPINYYSSSTQSSSSNASNINHSSTYQTLEYNTPHTLHNIGQGSEFNLESHASFQPSSLEFCSQSHHPSVVDIPTPADNSTNTSATTFQNLNQSDDSNDNNGNINYYEQLK